MMKYKQSTAEFWVNKIIEDAKIQERKRIIKIIKETPNLEKNYFTIIKKISYDVKSEQNTKEVKDGN